MIEIGFAIMASLAATGLVWLTRVGIECVRAKRSKISGYYLAVFISNRTPLKGYVELLKLRQIGKKMTGSLSGGIYFEESNSDETSLSLTTQYHSRSDCAGWLSIWNSALLLSYGFRQMSDGESSGSMFLTGDGIFPTRRLSQTDRFTLRGKWSYVDRESHLKQEQKEGEVRLFRYSKRPTKEEHQVAARVGIKLASCVRQIIDWHEFPVDYMGEQEMFGYRATQLDPARLDPALLISTKGEAADNIRLSEKRKQIRKAALLLQAEISASDKPDVEQDSAR